MRGVWGAAALQHGGVWGAGAPPRSAGAWAAAAPQVLPEVWESKLRKYLPVSGGGGSYFWLEAVVLKYPSQTPASINPFPEGCKVTLLPPDLFSFPAHTLSWFLSSAYFNTR